MGTPLPPDPPPIEYGDDCIHCYPADETPLILYAIFSGMALCPNNGEPPLPPNNIVFELTQSLENPCAWVGEVGVFHAEYFAAREGEDGYSTLSLWVPLWGDYFYVWPWDEPICAMGFANRSHCGIEGALVAGGSGVVTLTSEIVEVAQKLNIQPSDDLKAEVFPISAEHAIYKYCDKPLSTNIKIKHEH